MTSPMCCGYKTNNFFTEKSMLLELSNLSAASGQLLRQVTHASLQEMSRYRKQLIELATLMTRYTLQMSSDDCGGLSEYVEFFTAMRDVCALYCSCSETNPIASRSSPSNHSAGNCEKRFKKLWLWSTPITWRSSANCEILKETIGIARNTVASLLNKRI